MVYDYLGIHLKDEKQLMVRNRLSKRLKKLSLSSFGEYLDFVGSKNGADEFQEFINAITTNKTDFFREHKQFEILESTILPEFVQKKKGTKEHLRIWSAGCSTGAEPYTIAMVCSDFLAKKGLDFKILATDVNSEVLNHGKQGVYSESDLQPVPPAMLKRYFLKGVGENEGYYQAKKILKDKIVFHPLNLFLPVFPIRDNIDILFCRNVAIYFDKVKKEELFAKYYDIIRPGGYLFIGHSESLSTINKDFQFIKNNIYRKPAGSK